MRTSAIVRIVLYSIAIVVLLSILAGSLLLNTAFVNTDWESFFISENSGTLGSVGSVDANTVRDIAVEWAAGSITIRPGDVTEITFSETEGLSEKDQMIWSQKGDKLVIQFCRTRVYFGISIDMPKDLEIIVPLDWNCGTLEIDAASAEVKVMDMTIGTVDFDGASGVCKFENCHVDHLDVDTASGNIQFSGTLTELDCDAASASCELLLTNCPKRIDADMASGDLRLTLPEDCGFTVKIDALSGDFTSEFPTTSQNGKRIYGDGSCVINVSALSGDVTIYKGSAG